MRSEANAGRQRLVVAGLHGICLAILALHLYARTLPATPTSIPEAGSAEAAWWGLWPVAYAPAWAAGLATGIVVGMIVFFWWREIREWRREVAYQSLAIRNSQFAVLCLVSLVLFLAFFSFPIVHTRWGDAYILAKSIAWPDPALRLTYSWQAPLDVYLHSRVWYLLHGRLGWGDAMPAYRLLSPLAGALYLLAVLALSRNRRLAPAWLTFGLLCSLGLVQLFFGYVENYSFAAAGVLIYLWLGLEVLDHHRPLWLASLWLAFCIATHPSTVVLAPSLLYLGWRAVHTETPDQALVGNQTPLSVVFQIGLPMMAVGVATVLLMELGGHGLHALFTTDRPGGGDARWFVPLWQTSTRWEQYTLFGWAHLRDFVNGQLLVAPVVLLSLAWGGYWLVANRSWEMRPSSFQSPTFYVRFLLSATVAYWFFIWVWNPDYGGQRDWDLFSLAALPATLLLISVLPRVLPQGRYLVMGAAPLIAVQLLHTLAWIYQNTLPWEWPG